MTRGSQKISENYLEYDFHEDKVLKVQMLGLFKVEGLDGELCSDKFRSGMLIKLFAYIISHHENNMSVNELIDVLWPDEESDDPVGALRNLIHRLRGAMKKIWGPASAKFIHTGDGFYYWNKEYQLEIDVEQFETACKAAGLSMEVPERIERYKEAVALYKGRYMSGYDDVYWIASSATYYHSLYLNTVKNYALLLEETGDFEEMEDVLRKALELEVIDEELHVLFIRALIRQGKLQLAEIQYAQSAKALYENLGLTHLEGMKEVYELLMKQNHDTQMDLHTVEKDLREDFEEGAFYCEYGVFKKIYQLEVRRAERLGVSVFISLVSIRLDVKGDMNDPSNKKFLLEAMDIFQQVLLKSLRSGDVITRYSRNQFILLLPTCQYETARKVMARVEKNFYGKVKRNKVELVCSMNGI